MENNTYRKKILIVEDKDDIRALMRFLLISGYIVVQARDGKEGLEAFELSNPDLIITDLNMPIMTGLELVKYIRATPNNGRVSIIAISASFDNSENQIEMLKAGADLCLVKPICIIALREAVNHLLSATPSTIKGQYRELSYNQK